MQLFLIFYIPTYLKDDTLFFGPARALIILVLDHPLPGHALLVDMDVTGGHEHVPKLRALTHV